MQRINPSIPSRQGECTLPRCLGIYGLILYRHDELQQVALYIAIRKQQVFNLFRVKYFLYYIRIALVVSSKMT